MSDQARETIMYGDLRVDIDDLAGRMYSLGGYYTPWHKLHEMHKKTYHKRARNFLSALCDMDNERFLFDAASATVDECAEYLEKHADVASYKTQFTNYCKPPYIATLLWDDQAGGEAIIQAETRVELFRNMVRVVQGKT